MLPTTESREQRPESHEQPKKHCRNCFSNRHTCTQYSGLSDLWFNNSHITYHVASATETIPLISSAPISNEFNINVGDCVQPSMPGSKETRQIAMSMCNIVITCVLVDHQECRSPQTTLIVKASTDNMYQPLLSHSTQTIESHFLDGKPFLTNEELAFLIAFFK
jgi:hypothetical protein